MAAWGTAASWFVRKSSSEISPEKLPALPLRRRSVLLHDGGLQPQAEAAATGGAPNEELQALGTHLAEANGLGT